MYPAPASTISVGCVIYGPHPNPSPKNEGGARRRAVREPPLLSVCRLPTAYLVPLSSRRDLREGELSRAAAMVVQRRNRAVAIGPGKTIEWAALRADPLVLRRPPPRPDRRRRRLEAPRLCRPFLRRKPNRLRLHLPHRPAKIPRVPSHWHIKPPIP